jgi:phosphate transporter family protein
MYLTSQAIRFLKKDKESDLSKAEIVGAYKKGLDGATKFIPDWVRFSVALALGLGTMIGWKRIVITVGEKIGKQHMTYGQGAAAEIVAMGPPTVLACRFRRHMCFPRSSRARWPPMAQVYKCRRCAALCWHGC